MNKKGNSIWLSTLHLANSSHAILQWRDCGKGQTTSQLTTSIKLD